MVLFEKGEVWFLVEEQTEYTIKTRLLELLVDEDELKAKASSIAIASIASVEVQKKWFNRFVKIMVKGTTAID